jgi:hypothetical protein
MRSSSSRRRQFVVTPIRLLIRSAAATDPDMAALLDASDGVTLAEATDVMWTCSSVEIYELLVLKRGWSPQRFASFVADFMITALLPELP